MTGQVKWAIDTETTGLDPYKDELILIGMCTDDGREHVWDYRKDKIPKWFEEGLENLDILKIYHNASFDTKIFWHNMRRRSRNNYCTLQNEKIIHLGDMSKGCTLGETLKRRFNITLDKSFLKQSMRGYVGHDEKEGVLRDVRWLIPTQEQQVKEMTAVDNMLNASRIENELCYVVGAMEYNGLPFDLNLYDKYVDKLLVLKNDCAKIVWDLMEFPYTTSPFDGTVSGGFNIMSEKQAKQALANAGIKFESYGKDILLNRLGITKNIKKRSIIRTILEYKKWKSALGWNFDKKYNKKTGCLHPSYKALGAESGRFSSKNPNGQNITKNVFTFYLDDDDKLKMNFSDINFRKLFVPPTGYKWVCADYSQIELRLYGGIADVASIKKEYAKGKSADLHRQVAARIFEKSYDEVSDTERNVGKPGNFGGRVFGGGPNAIINAALSYGLIMDWPKAEGIQQTLLELDPEGVIWGKKITEEGRAQGYLMNAGGYRRLFTNEKIIKETVCRNTPIQGLAAVIVKEALILFYDWTEKVSGIDNVKLVGTVHDEISCIAKDEWAQRAYDNLIRCMLEAGEKYMKDLGIPCGVEGAISDYWNH